MLVFPNFVLVSCNATPCQHKVELSDTPLPKIVLVSLNPTTPMFSYNRGHTEGITADSCVMEQLCSKGVSQVNIDLEIITGLFVIPHHSCDPILYDLVIITRGIF